MDRKIEFYVHGIVEGESGLLRVVGRCCEDTIRVSDCFESAFEYKFSTADGGIEKTLRLHPTVVHLSIVRIHAYGRFLESLSSGMTGALDLQGEGTDLVRPGLVLGAEPLSANAKAGSPDTKSNTLS